MRNARLTISRSVITAFLLAMAMNGAQASEGHEEEHIIAPQVGGVKIDGGMTWFLQATDGLTKNVTALSYTFDLALEAEVGKHGKAIIALEAGDGEGVDPAIGSLSGANYDAFYTELTNNVGGSTNVVVPSISQAYFEGEYLAGDLVLSLGKLDIHSMFDDNAYANDETDQFMSAMFSRSADTSYGQLDYYYAPGITLQYELSEMVAVTLIAANGNASGFNDVFDNMYLVAQVNIQPAFTGRAGNYRFYVISDGRDSTDSDGNTLTTFTKIGSSLKTKNSAWGLSFDQAIAANIGVFTRYSAQDDDIIENTVTSSWSLGALFDGDGWGREHDTIGIAYGSVNLTTASAALQLYNYGDDGAPSGDDNLGITNFGDESHVEIFYKLGFGHLFTLTADIQVIENKGGNAAADKVTVAGLRGQLNF